ncbi:MAG: tungstate ABC transporter substrate-binding protein WtpA [Nitrospirota bacterium]
MIKTLKRGKIYLLNLLAVFFVGILFIFCGSASQREELIIFHAGSLSVPFKELVEGFNKKYPDVLVLRESAGSRVAARKVSELKKPADIVAVADYEVIEEILMPEYTNWYISFATNKMVIAYTDTSKYANEINEKNWYEILTRPGVNYGHSDPNTDPCGYRALLVWQLAEKYYRLPGLYEKLQRHCPKKNIRPKETDLIALTQAGELDYQFQYLSVARQHNLKVLTLPPQIDLSQVKYANFYKQAKVQISGEKPGKMVIQTGAPITYALTIPNNAPNKKSALEFIKFVLSPAGQKIMAKNDQPPIIPAIANDKSKVPLELQRFKKDEKR